MKKEDSNTVVLFMKPVPLFVSVPDPDKHISPADMLLLLAEHVTGKRAVFEEYPPVPKDKPFSVEQAAQYRAPLILAARLREKIYQAIDAGDLTMRTEHGGVPMAASRGAPRAETLPFGFLEVRQVETTTHVPWFCDRSEFQRWRATVPTQAVLSAQKPALPRPLWLPIKAAVDLITSRAKVGELEARAGLAGALRDGVVRGRMLHEDSHPGHLVPDEPSPEFWLHGALDANNHISPVWRQGVMGNNRHPVPRSRGTQWSEVFIFEPSINTWLASASSGELGGASTPAGSTALPPSPEPTTPKSITAGSTGGRRRGRTKGSGEIDDAARTFLATSDELRGVLNSGHSRNGSVIRVVGDDHEARQFSTWAPVAIASIGKQADTLMDRSVIIRMQRRRSDQPVKRLRLSANEDFARLARQCARWAVDNAISLAMADPDLPPELNDRAADNWRPLVAIADRVGGDWPKRARAAALKLSVDTDEPDTARTMLLTDLRDLFTNRNVTTLSSGEIVAALATMESRPWPEWKAGKPITPRQIAKLMSAFEIAPVTVRMGSDTAKGYRLEALLDVFARYLPSQSVTPSQATPSMGCDVFEKVTCPIDVTDLKTSQALSQQGCDVVTDTKAVLSSKGEEALPWEAEV